MGKMSKAERNHIEREVKRIIRRLPALQAECNGNDSWTYLEYLRSEIEKQYEKRPTGCGCTFGEILCWELHSNGKTFKALSKKWAISLPTLGELIWDHCKRLEEPPMVSHTRAQ